MVDVGRSCVSEMLNKMRSMLKALFCELCDVKRVTFPA